MIAVSIFLDGMDFVVKKPRGFCLCMRNQGFLFREIQFEFFLQKCPQLLLDFLCFLLWADKSQKKVICVSYVAKSSVVGVIWVDGRKLLRLLSECLGLFFFFPLSGLIGCTVYELFVGRVRLSFLPFGILWNEYILDKLVQFVQIQVGQDGTHHAPYTVANLV